LYVQKSFEGVLPDEWHIEFNPLWSPSESEQAATDNVKAQGNNVEVTMLLALMNNSIISPEEVRKIVVNKYAEYEFPDEIPSDVQSNVDYAAGVDPTQMDVPADPNAPTTQ
jgi:hypothetical protein